MLVSEPTTSTTSTPVETLLFVPEVVAVAPTAGPVEGPALSRGVVPVISHLRPPAVPGLGCQQTESRCDLTVPLTVR